MGLLLRDGQLVPSSTMVALLKEAILAGDSERFLLDGFPRSKDNLEAWFEVFSDHEVQVSSSPYETRPVYMSRFCRVLTVWGACVELHKLLI